MSTTEYQYGIGLCQFTTRLRGGRTLDKPVLDCAVTSEPSFGIRVE